LKDSINAGTDNIVMKNDAIAIDLRNWKYNDIPDPNSGIRQQ
jgi:hypothetical protein